jgi:glyoxylase-like metal-dependent hydrolase (beta-lactamase superfamily II)
MGKIPFSNAFLVKDCLFDTGISPIRLRNLKKNLTINKIIFSHWHDDHIRDNGRLGDIPRYCHTKERDIIENSEKILHQYNLIGSEAEKMFRKFITEVIKIENIHINGTFQDGKLFDFGNGLKFKAIHAPGHSRGHCIFYSKEEKLAFLADIDLSDFGPWYGANDSDLLQFEESIEMVSRLDLELVVTGHSGLFKGRSLIKKKLNQYKRVIIERDEKILAHMNEKKPISADDLYMKNLIYNSYGGFGDFIPIMERTMIQKHFKKFLKKEIIEESNNGYILA